MSDLHLRKTYVVTYDVADPKRLRSTFKVLRGYGDHLQLSVFRCELNARELAELRGKLAEVINHAEDQVLFIDLGLAQAGDRIQALGRSYEQPVRSAVVV